MILVSAARPRYRKDVLRSIAAPMGATLRYRYESKWVAPSILDDVGSVVGACVLVCFIDPRLGRESLLYPVRAATILAINQIGSTVAIEIETEEFVHGPIDFCTKRIRDSVKQAVFRKGTDGDSSGFLFLTTVVPFDWSGLEVESRVETWEKMVECVAGSDTFNKELMFWTVLSVSESSSKLDLDVFTKVPRALKGSASHIVRVYHYVPKSIDQGRTAELVCDIGGAAEAQSQATVQVDSRYDLKRWLFVTQGSYTESRHAWLIIAPREGASWGVELHFHVNRILTRGAGMTFFIAVFLFLSSIGSFTDPTPIEIALACLGSLLASVFIVFGIKKV